MIKKSCFWLGLFLAAAVLIFPQDTILIKNATIIPVTGNPISNGSLLIKEGKIAKIGSGISAPPDAKIIDAAGKFVYPGMVAPMTALGVTGYPGAGNDQNEVGISTAFADPYDALNPEDSTIEVTRIGGVTTAHVASGSRNIFNGKSIVINLDGSLAPEMVIDKYTAQIINIGARQNNRYPSTLPGTISYIRDKLNQARDYLDKRKKDAKTGEKGTAESRNLEMEALAHVVAGEVPAIIITTDEVTLRNALQLIRDYKLKAVIQASSGIHKYLDRLAEAKIPVIWGGTTTGPGRWEPFDLYFRTAGMMAEKGILFAFAQGGSHNVRNLPLPAALSVAHGLPEAEALKALTINPARILGIDDQVGSLEVGKTANVVIWTGSPLQMTSRVDTVIIQGRIIPLTSVQTRLYDKFEKIVKERMRKKK